MDGVRINQLYQEETLQVLKDLRTDLSRSGAGELIKNIEKVKGDKGDAGVSIKNISTLTLDQSVIVTVEKTDGSELSFEVERLKGIDGKDGKNGLDGIHGKDGERGPRGERGPKGEKGQDGRDGNNGKDGRSFIWRGIWKTSTQYKQYDVVEFEGSSYIAVKNTTSTRPASSRDWELVAKKGKDGRNGVNSSGGASTAYVDEQVTNNSIEDRNFAIAMAVAL